MKKTKNFLPIMLLLCIFIFPVQAYTEDLIPLPVSLALAFSGDKVSYGIKGKNAAELAIQKINDNGGIAIGKKHYSLQLILTDNKENPKFVLKTVGKAIVKDKVLAVIGPHTSDAAVPMALMAETYKTPMITPWAASSAITKNKKYAFRLCVGGDQQSKAIVKLANNRWSAPKVAILYDEIGEFSKTTAKAFRSLFSKEYGKDAIVAYETFRGEKTDAKKQLMKIAKTDASFIFLPISREQALPIMKQAEKLGMVKPFVATDWLNNEDFTQKCGTACKNLNVIATFSPRGVTGKAKDFVALYKKTYGSIPTEEATLTYDAVMILAKAFASMSKISGNLVKDRKELRDKIANLKDVKTITGNVSYSGDGEPRRCALLIRVENGMLIKDKFICP